MNLGIKDKVALITGGSTGIGYATARMFLEEGAKVFIVARTEDRLMAAAKELKEATGGEIGYASIDLGKPGDAEKAVGEAAKTFGGLHILVNNAGRAHAGGLLQTEEADWRDMAEVKIFGMLEACRAAHPHMKKAGWGRIVNISSIGGAYPTPKLMISHSLSAAINNFTKSFALEVAKDNILVNAVGCGAVMTENWKNNMIGRVREDHPEWSNLSDEEVFTELGALKTPVGKFGEPEDIAAVAAFFASDRNRFVTGDAIEASGGADQFI